MWRGDLPKAGVEGNVPGVMGVEGRSSKAGVEGNVPGVVDVEGGSSKSWDGGEMSQEWWMWRGNFPVVTFIITDSMQIDFEVIRCPVNQELLVIN